MLFISLILHSYSYIQTCLVFIPLSNGNIRYLQFKTCKSQLLIILFQISIVLGLLPNLIFYMNIYKIASDTPAVAFSILTSCSHSTTKRQSCEKISIIRLARQKCGGICKSMIDFMSGFSCHCASAAVKDLKNVGFSHLEHYPVPPIVLTAIPSPLGKFWNEQIYVTIESVWLSVRGKELQGICWQLQS